MATADGRSTDSLMAELKARPWEFDFYVAGRMIQSAFSEKPRVGCSTTPSQDPVRFAQSPAIDFAPATLEALVQKEGRAPTLYTRHFGLFGPHGPLPMCLTEYARERILHHRDQTFAMFCNVFHHRLISFFFRAWADVQKTVDYDRPEDQHWGYFVGSLAGFGMDGVLNRESVPDRAKLFYAGRLGAQARNAEGLEAIVADFFGHKTEVSTFLGRWTDLPGDSRCCLGKSSQTGQLGSNVILGSRVLTCQMTFRICMGPMRLTEYERLLPGGRSFQRLREWVRQYDTSQHDWDLQLILRKEEVPQVQLGGYGRLGWTTWLKTKAFEEDAADLTIVPREEMSPF